MPLAKQDLAFSFGAVNQARNRRSLGPGDLVEAINVRQIIDEAYRKRRGYDRTVPTASSGSITTPWESYISDGKSRIGRDADDEVWRLNGASWETRGTANRALPSIFPHQTVPSAARPVAVAVGSNYWVFTLSSGAYRWSIFDSSGNIVKTSVTQTAASINYFAAEQDGTSVWVIWTDGTTTVRSHKFNIAVPTTAVVSATYRTVGQAGNGVDMHRLASTEIAVAICDNNTGAAGTPNNIDVSYLDTATGAAKVSPAPVVTQIDTTASLGNHRTPPSILTSDGSNGSWYAVIKGLGGSGLGITGQSATDANMILFTINATTLATSGVTLATFDDTNQVIVYHCGYLAGNGDRVVFASSDTFTGTPTQPRPYTLTRYTYNGSTVTTLVIRRYSYPVSKPRAIGSEFYLLTGYDDGSTLNATKSYFLIDTDGNIVTQIAYAQAAAVGVKADPTIALSNIRSFATKLWANGNKLDCALLIETGAGGGAANVNDFAPALVSLDTAAPYAAPVRIRDGMVLWPGGTPAVAGTSDSQHEIALMLSPVNATFTAGAGSPLAGPTVVQYVYRIVDSDGTIYRSAPSPSQTTTFNNGAGAQVIVKPLTHLLPPATAQIEVYLSVANATQPFLHAVVDNDTTVDTITVAVTPASVVAAETLYTFGGGLDNAPVPQSRAVAYWRNRTFIATGTELWPSLERDPGLGPRYNEALVTLWDDGEGDIIGVAPVDWNYLAIFKREAIGLIGGVGPNITPGGGVAGNYEVQTLRLQRGNIVVRSIVKGPQGCYFQNSADGRIYCVTGAAEIIDVSHGMESYTTETVVATNYVDRDRQVHFYMSSGAIMVLDFAHPANEQPAGRWTRWTSSGLLVAAGAAIDSAGAPSHLETTGAVRTQGSGFQDATATTPADVFMSWTTGDLAAVGGIRGEFRVDAVQVDGEWLATNTSRLSVVSDHGVTTTTHTTASLTAAPQELHSRPAGHSRVRSVRIKYEETAGSGEGFIAQGVTITIQSRGRAKFPSNNRRVA